MNSNSIRRELDIDVYDEFMSTIVSSTLIGDLGWASSGLSVIQPLGSEPGHPGIQQILLSSGAVAGHLWLNSVLGTIASFDGLTFVSINKLSDISSGAYIDFGIGKQADLANNFKKLVFEPAVSPNWRVVHGSNVGAILSSSDTGLAAALGWNILTLKFGAGDVSTGRVTNANGTGGATNSTALGTLGTQNHGPSFHFKSPGLARTYNMDMFRMFGSSARL